MSQTTIAPEVLALLWTMKIDVTGLAEMPLNEAHDAVRERVEQVLKEDDHIACQAITDLLNRKVWSARMLEYIAEILRKAGYQIDAPERRDVDDEHPHLRTHLLIDQEGEGPLRVGCAEMRPRE